MFEWFNVGISFASPKFEYSYSPVASKIEVRIFCFVYKSLILFKFKWVILIKKKNSGVCLFSVYKDIHEHNETVYLVMGHFALYL